MRRSWPILAARGVGALAFGALTLTWPPITTAITSFVLTPLIGAWALITGIAEITTAARLRTQVRGELLLALAGAVSAVAGLLILIQSGLDARHITMIIGGYAVAHGIVLTILAVTAARSPAGTHPAAAAPLIDPGSDNP